MYTKSMLVVLVCILALGFSGFPVVEGKSSKKAFTWNRKERLIVTFTGKNRPDDREKFTKETVSPLLKMFPGLNIWGSLSLLDFAKKKKDIRAIKRRHTIFIVLSESLYDLEDLEAEYPDLLPVSTEKLKSFLKTYSYPLLYFSRDRRRKIRGVIIVTKKVTPSFLTNVLTKKNIPLDTPFQYEKEELKKAEKKKLEKEKNFTWNPKERQIFTVSGERFVEGEEEFFQEIRKVLPRANSWGTSLSLLYLVKEKKRLGTIKSSHTIFMIRPEYLYHFEELEAEYPDLLPVSTEKLKSFLKTYGYPLLYFSHDYTGMIRGVVIAEEVTPSLARVLTEKPIPLDTLLGYENGKLEKAEKKKEKEEEKEEEKEKTFTWNRRQRLIITVTGRRWVFNHSEFDKFAKEMQKAYGREMNVWGSPSFLNFIKKKEEIETIKSHNTIFMIRPECLYDLESLEAEYPDLLPVSCQKLEAYLKSYSLPLLYFSRDYTGKIRGVIIAKEVTTDLAKLLIKKAIPLDTLLQYKNRELKKAEKSRPKQELTFIWNYQERLIITVTGRPFTAGFKEFAKEAQKVYGRRFNAWGTRSLLDYAKNKERIEVIRSNNTIFTVRPESLYDLEDLEAEYPDLLPIPAEKLKSYLKTYGYPLLYFSLDYTGMLRGVIITKEVSPSLAKLLTKKPIPLDTPLQYKNGKLEKMEK